MPKAMPLLKHDSVSTNSDSATSAYSKETLSISTHSLSIQSSNIALSAVQDADDDCIIISNEDDDSKETKLSEEAMIDSPTKTISQVNYQLCNKSPKKQSQRMLVLFGCAGKRRLVGTVFLFVLVLFLFFSFYLFHTIIHAVVSE